VAVVIVTGLYRGPITGTRRSPLSGRRSITKKPYDAAKSWFRTVLDLLGEREEPLAELPRPEAVISTWPTASRKDD